jgi:hypothetical protein
LPSFFVPIMNRSLPVPWTFSSKIDIQLACVVCYEINHGKGHPLWYYAYED